MNLDIIDVSKFKGGANRRYKNKSKLMPKFPFNLLVCGKTNSGKSCMVLNLIYRLLSFSKLYFPPLDIKNQIALISIFAFSVVSLKSTKTPNLGPGFPLTICPESWVLNSGCLSLPTSNPSIPMLVSLYNNLKIIETKMSKM